MATDVVMPQMGESIAEGTITKWLKNVGDHVDRDEPLFEISTDKVDAEIPSPAAGTLTEIKYKEGETVEVNTVVAVLDGNGAKPSVDTAAAKVQETPVAAKAESPTQPPPPPPAPQTIERPKPTITTVEQGPPKAAPGKTEVKPLVRREGPAHRTEAPAPPRDDNGAPSAQELRRSKSSPLVRKIAEEHGIDLKQLEGTGMSGRVTKNDILSVMRKKIAEHMVLSRRTSAHVTTVYEVDMSRVAKLRDENRESFQERTGTKLTYMPFIFKAVTDAIRKFPAFNAQVSGDQIIYKRDINLGMAVALDWGLIVPVIKRADDLSVSGLARAANDLADRARTKQLKPDEVAGGTFTITNPGVFGGLFGTPIKTPPQVAILGVGKIEKRAKNLTTA